MAELGGRVLESEVRRDRQSISTLSTLLYGSTPL